MNEKQFSTIVHNMKLMSAYQQQVIGHLVCLVHGLMEVSVEIGAQAGLDGNDLRAKFATASRKMNNALAEIPFPDLEDLSKDDRRNFDEPPTGTPPKS